ncbi:MAG: FAD-dependent oxidoreductase [Acidimicrobiales bacterium]
MRSVSRDLLVATGSHPIRPPDIPFDGRTVVDSDEIVALDRPFRSLMVVGAGAVGCEYEEQAAESGLDDEPSGTGGSNAH